MANFQQAFQHTAAAEGGYSNNPKDKGGETYRGIARKYWPDWAGWIIVDEYKRNMPGATHDRITKELSTSQQLALKVESFYRINFWDKMQLDHINNQSLAVEMFDTGVNMDDNISIRFAQQAYNLLSNNGELYTKIKADGQIGPVTINSLNNHRYPDRLLKLMNIQQGARYIQLCLNDPSQETFLAGWLTRVQ